ncbi:MAG: uncharacterized protein A8A55_3178 [Amphiamblys sp. WSBS2006]|nr:MAG: uncharacterized protein A8A55_3178 [Amphiamblys sp. WSBS2006]
MILKVPKLVLHKENVMEYFCLEAWTKEQVSVIMRAEDSSIRLGKMKKLRLRAFAINILPKLGLHKEDGMERVCLEAWEKEQFSEIMRAKNNSVLFGKVKRLELWVMRSTSFPDWPCTKTMCWKSFIFALRTQTMSLR